MGRNRMEAQIRKASGPALKLSSTYEEKESMPYGS